jgi:hypothetical protein
VLVALKVLWNPSRMNRLLRAGGIKYAPINPVKKERPLRLLIGVFVFMSAF